MNKVIIQGNLGSAPDFKSASGKIPVCVFSVATNERSRAKSGKQLDVTEWHRVVTFGKTAEACSKWLKKGDSTLIEGKIRSSKWTDKEGKERFSYRLVADSVKFLSKKSTPFETNVQSSVPEVSDDIPF